MTVSRKVVRRLCACALAGLALLGLLAPSAVAAPGAVKVGSPPHVPSRSKAIGALSGTTTLAITVTLQPRDPAGLQALASQVATPGSSVYHDYLSVAQFAQRFGPTTPQIDAVEASMRAHGLHPGSVSPNGLSIRVVANAERLERAFSTSFERYLLPDGRTAFANVSAPLLDASVAKTVQGVIGLDTLATPRPIGLLHPQGTRARAQTPHVVTGGPQPCAAATTAQSSAQGSGSHTADQLASAYRFSSLYGSGDLGAGQTIALYELEPYDPNDIAAYQACYGTSTSVSDVPVDGGAGSGAGAGEAALDIEDVLGLAPKANILVYSGPNSNSGSPGSGPYDTYSTIISQDVAKVISTSWGICESQEGSSNAAGEYTLFEEAATQGQTVVAAAGDSGAEDCTDQNGNPIGGPAVDDPASQPFVTGVGGTTLDALGPPPSETVWNESSQHPPQGAGGGGISSFWTMPSYQSSAAASLNVINASSSGSPCHASNGGYCREVPDVSADADPFTGYLFYYNGAGTVIGAPSGWVGIGGTSAAAPLWAALLALTDASRVCNGTPIGFANPGLYHAAGSAYTSVFNDITSGNNNYTGAGGFSAGLGYDMASGLGTPNGSALSASLCGDTITVSNPGTQASIAGKPVSLALSAASSGGFGLAYAAAGLPAGLSINPSTGVISGTPTTIGRSAVVVTATASSGAAGSATFGWSVVAPTVSVRNPGNQTGTVGKPVRLQIAATVNNGRAPTYSVSRLPPGLSINAHTGLISGTPRTAGRSAVTVRATDASGAFDTVTFSWTIGGRPSASRASFRGIAKDEPTLSFTLAAGTNAPGIRTVVVGPPGGVRFASSARDLSKGIIVKGPGGRSLRFTAKVSHGALTITLASPVARLQVTIEAPAIGVSQTLAARVAGSHVRTLDVVVKATDSSRNTTRLVLKISAS